MRSPRKRAFAVYTNDHWWYFLSSVCRWLFYLAFWTSDCIVRPSRCVSSFAIARACVNPHRREEARLTTSSSASHSGCLSSITRNKKRKENLFRVNADCPVMLILCELNRQLRVKSSRLNWRNWTGLSREPFVNSAVLQEAQFAFFLNLTRYLLYLWYKRFMCATEIVGINRNQREGRLIRSL